MLHLQMAGHPPRKHSDMINSKLLGTRFQKPALRVFLDKARNSFYTLISVYIILDAEALAVIVPKAP